MLNYQAIENQKLDDMRRRWIKQIIIQGQEGFIGAKLENYICEITNTKDDLDFRKAEIIKEEKQSNAIKFPPDLEIAEEGLIKLEDRSSIILAASIFIPLIFALAHLFRYVTSSTLFWELQSLFLLISGLTSFYIKSLDYKGWEKSLTKLKEFQDHIIIQGSRSEYLFPELFREVTKRELNQVSKLVNYPSASHAISSVISTSVRLPQTLRKIVLNSFLQLTKDIPVKERTMEVRWKALKARILLTSSIGAASSGLLAGIATFSIPYIVEGLTSLKPTDYLAFALFILTLTSTIKITSPWLAKKERPRWVLLFSGIYWSMFLLTQTLIY